MDLARIERATADIIGLYQIFLAALGGRYLAQRAAGVAPLQGIAELQRSGYVFARTFLDAATERVHDYASDSPDGAPSALSSALAARADALIALYKTAVVRNIKQAEGWMAHGQQLVDPFTRPSGAVGLLWQQKVAQPEFKLPDSIGRDWDAAAMMRASTRDTFYQAELDAEIVIMKEHGITLAQVRHPSANDKNGMVLALVDGTMFASVHDPKVRAKIFHPNAQATLEPHHDVSA